MDERKEPRLTYSSMKVLKAFMENPMGELAGAEIHKLASVGTGTLYPILLRFEAAGWLKSRWEAIDPKEAGRPRKRLYHLTPDGMARASAALGTFGVEAFA